jgi:uncharacterized coiled-coil DUF342 family protein
LPPRPRPSTIRLTATTSPQDETAATGQAEQQAQQDADAAKQAAEKADHATDKAKAEADQAKAETEAVQSKAAIAADCAKAYVSAFGTLFEGGDQAATVRDQLQGITADCKAALGGA